MVEKDEETGEEFMSLADVFTPEEREESVRLALSDEEWEIIIVLAEAGGDLAMKKLLAKSGMEPGRLSSMVDSLSRRGILARGPGKAPAAEEKGKAKRIAAYLSTLKDRNHYQALGVPAPATQAEIKRAYFKHMHEYHPDRFGMEKDPEIREDLKEIFRILTRAYETLSSPQSRHDYDLTIPEFTGVHEREEEQALATLIAGDLDRNRLPETAPNPDLAKSFYESGLDDFSHGDTKAAELNFKLAASLDPGNKEYQDSMNKTRRLNDKVRAREAAIRAVYHEEEGKLRSAVRSMAWAAELDPEVPEYQYDLARILLEQGTDLAAARMHVLLALDRHPGKLDYLLLLARAQSALNEKADAKRTCKKVLSLDPKNLEAKKILEDLEAK